MVRAVVLALCLVATTAFVPAAVKKQALVPNKMSDDAAAEEPPAPAADPAPMAEMPAAPAPAPVTEMMAESDDARTARIVALPGMSTKADLVQIQKELCPAVPYWDPLQLADQTFWSEPNEATIGFLRQAEIKHGRVAMAGFVGFCVHANGYRWPAAMTLDGQPFPDIKECSSPVELWDKIPEAAKWQIILCAYRARAPRVFARENIDLDSLSRSQSSERSSGTTSTSSRVTKASRSTTCAAAFPASTRRSVACRSTCTTRSSSSRR